MENQIFACRRIVQVFPIQGTQDFYFPAETPTLLFSCDI